MENTKEIEVPEIQADDLRDLTEIIGEGMGLKKEEPVLDEEVIPETGDLTAEMLGEMGGSKEIENKTPEEYKELKDILMESFKTEFGEDFKFKEELNDENWVKEVYKTIEERALGSLHPMVRDLQLAASRGIDPEEVIRDYVTSRNDFSNRTPEDIVRQDLTTNYGVSDKRPKGWTEEKINNIVENLKKTGLIDIEAEKVKLNSQNTSQNAMKEKISTMDAANMRKRQEAETVVKNRVNEVMNKFDKWDDVLGIEVGKAEKAQFSKDFPNLVSPDPKTGKVWIEEQLSNDETLAKVCYILRNEGLVKSALTKAKESAKRNVLEKLDPEPRNVRKSGGQVDILNPDMDALGMPEKLTSQRTK